MAAGGLPLISNGKGRRFICCRRTRGRGISLSFAIQGKECSYVSFASFVVRFVLSAKALAIDLNSPSNPDAVSALKDALSQGSTVAVSKLGVENGFLGNDKVEIALPDLQAHGECFFACCA